MESQRNILLIALLLVSYLIWNQWEADHAPKPAVTETAAAASTQQAANNNVDTTSVSASDNQVAASKELIHVTTDQLDVLINPVGGDIVRAALVSHKLELNKDEPFVLLEQKPDFSYIAQSSLIGQNGIDSDTKRAAYAAEKQQYTLADGQDKLEVPLTFVAANGVTYTKVFTFTKGKFDVRVDYRVNNTSAEPLKVQMSAKIAQTIKESDSHMMMPTYRGAAFSTTETRYEKYDFDDISKKNLLESTQGGWVAMLQHYFVSAWVPPADETNTLVSAKVGAAIASIGFEGAVKTVAPGETKTVGADFYVGPKDQAALSELSPTLNLVVDYGVLWWLAVPIYQLMMFFHSFVGNWGLAIILITFTVRGILFPLTKAQYTSMAKMRNLQPKMQELKDRFGDDRQKMGQAMMELYKKEKVNPMGGCLPIVLQMPIFFALYWVLMESVELRHAPFIFWIHDLSVQDPYYVLPILNGITMYIMQKLQPMSPTMDPMQAKMMQYMPVIFGFFFLWFPAGLVLYWLVGNIVNIVSQKIIYAGLEKKGLK